MTYSSSSVPWLRAGTVLPVLLLDSDSFFILLHYISTRTDLYTQILNTDTAPIMDDQKNLYLLHRILVQIAKFAVTSFFTEVRVIGGENVPLKGPTILCVLHLAMRIAGE